MKTLLILLGSAVVSCAAEPAPWLIGDWVFDSEYTLKKQAEKPLEKDLVGATKAAVKGQLNEQMKGAKLNFTSKEFIMTTKEGNGKAFPYTVLENSGNDAVTVKTSDGEVTTFHRDGDRLWTTSTGNVNEPFYFKRK